MASRLKRIGKRMGKIVAYSLLGIVSLVAWSVAGVLITLRTDWGHREILAIAMPLLQKQLAARLRVGRLDGNIVGGLELDDVELVDIEGQPAARARYITLRYGLASLLQRRLSVHAVTIEGGWARVRYLQDGRVNFAALPVVATAKVEAQKAQAEGKPFVIQIRDVHFDGQGAYEPQGVLSPGRIDHAAARVALVGEVDITVARDVRVDCTVQKLSVAASLPAEAQIDARGQLHIVNSDVRFDKASAEVVIDGEHANVLLPARAPRLRAGWHRLALRADGPLSNVSAGVDAQLPSGHVGVAGGFGVGEVVTWWGTVDATGLNPALLVKGAPAGSIELHAKGAGQNGRGTVDVAQLAVAVTGLVRPRAGARRPARHRVGHGGHRRA